MARNSFGGLHLARPLPPPTVSSITLPDTAVSGLGPLPRAQSIEPFPDFIPDHFARTQGRDLTEEQDGQWANFWANLALHQGQDGHDAVEKWCDGVVVEVEAYVSPNYYCVTFS